jgi:tRNA-dihydrouridine synthase B
MRVGPVLVAHPITLAPLEEHSHYYFRRLMKRFGASLVCGERVDAAAVVRRDRRAMRQLYTLPDEAPRAGQISGADPAIMAEAARIVEELGFDIVDLNFDCPIRRLLDRGEGGVLLADPPAIGRIIQAVTGAVTIPVTLKIRTGPDAGRQTAVEVACRAQDAGAAAVSVHARSVAQGYVGGPDWSVVTLVKRAVQMPVLCSGGIREAQDALRCLGETGADAVAIGRGCLGNPWIFQQAKALWSGSAMPCFPGAAQRGRALVELVEGEFRLYGPGLALRRLPRVSCYFAQSLPNYPSFRREVQKIRFLMQFRQLVKEYFSSIR